MLENIISYQKEYISILKDFIKQNRDYDDYLLLLDKIELLLKKNKKTITNFLELNCNTYVYYGGATYFDNYTNEINPIIFSGKKVIIADPIIKLTPFLLANNFFDFCRIKDIFENAIKNTINLEKELKKGKIIYINPNDYIKEIKQGIYETARDLTMQYLNINLNINYSDVNMFCQEYKSYTFDKLEKKFPRLNKILYTVDSTPNMRLKDKINQNYLDCGISKENIKELSSIEQIIITLIGLFGQAFELKSISMILNCPLYITRPNVLMYLNCINNIDEKEKKKNRETCILFSLYQILKYTKTIEIKKNTKKYNTILKKLLDKELTIEEYINEIKKLDII